AKISCVKSITRATRMSRVCGGTSLATVGLDWQTKQRRFQITMTIRGTTDIGGTYANYIVIGHNAFEFILNFGQLYEGNGEPRMHTRIVTAPVYAKAMLKTLNTAVSQFEMSHGALPDTEDPLP